MKGRFTLILLLLVILLGAFIFFFEREAPTTAQQNAEARKAFRIVPDSVEWITIESAALKLVCERRGHHWELIEPVKDRADDAKIERLLYYLDLLRKSTVITAAQRAERHLTLSDYGMDEPQATLTLVSEGRQREYLVGRKAVVGDRVYVKEEGADFIVPVDAQLLAVLPDSVSAWRSHDLFREDVSGMTRFSMRRNDGFLQLAKQDNGKWMMQQPVKAPASGVAVRQLIDLLNVLRIDRFVADQVGDPAAYGLENVKSEMAVGYRDDEVPRQLLVGNEAPEFPGCVYAKWADREFVYAVSNVVVQILDLPIRDFRERKITPMEADEVRGVMLAKGEQVLEFARHDDGRWEMLQPVRRPASDVLLDTLVELWCETAANEFVADNVTNLSEYGFAVPAARVLFSSSTNRINAQDSGRADVVEMQISSLPPTNGLALIRCASGSSVYGVALDLLRTVRMRPLFFRERTVLALKRDTLLSITLVDNERQQSIARADVSAPFALEGDVEGLVLDEEGLEALLRVVSGLVADNFVVENPDDLEIFGLKEPHAELRFGLTGAGGISKTLLIGAAVPGRETVYAMIRGQDVVFELNEVLVDIMVHGFAFPAEKQEGETLLEEQAVFE